MSLIKFYNKENVGITGSPQFSSQIFDYFRYIDAEKRLIFVLKISNMRKK